MNTDINAEGDFTAIERRAIECRDAEPRGATTCRRPHQALLAAAAIVGSSPFLSAALRLDEEFRRLRGSEEPELQGKKITSVIVDEFGPTQQFGRAMRGAYPPVIVYDGREVNHQLINYAAGWLWTSHRTRNLSHRPVVGARKRKAALKRAARQHRAAMKECRHV